MLDTTTTLADVLYPPIEPHSEGMLQVSDLHTIAWEQSGNPSGIPVVVIHGGPGVAGNHRTVSTSTRVRSTSSSSTSAGCGKSTPYAELEDNNTQASVADLEALREHLGIDRWHVFGGSWGSTLALIYAQHHPQRVVSLVLRGIFMCRVSELHWFYQNGASHLFPDAFEPYRNHIPEDERGSFDSSVLPTIDQRGRRRSTGCGKGVGRWEMATSRLFPDPEYLDKAEDLDFAVAFARIECHYFINAIFVEEAYILNNVDVIQHIPTTIVQGRYDVVCPRAVRGNFTRLCPTANS